MFSSKLRNILIILTLLLFTFTFILPGYANNLDEQIRQAQSQLSTIQQRLEDRGRQLAESQNGKKVGSRADEAGTQFNIAPERAGQS